MKRLPVLVVVALLAAVPARAQDEAKARLDKSPRHQEWLKLKHGDRTVEAFIVYPEVKNKATAVVVIHEIFGLSDWVRGVADQLAEAGYIAIAPDLLSGYGKDGGGINKIEPNEVGRLIRDLPPEQVTADLNSAVSYLKKVPACNGKVVVCGFCWGGGQTFRFATNNKDIKAAFVFYGTGPTDLATIERIKCPVYGFYAGLDGRVGETIPISEKLMKKAGKKYEPVTYEGARHGFMRLGEAANASEDNKKARDEAWQRWKKLLKRV
jgi:carboxymethylenebutenolidase